MKKTALIILIFLATTSVKAQHSRKSILKQPLKLGLGYIGNPCAMRVELGYMFFHENFLHPHQHQPYGEITNHNLSIGMDANFSSQSCLGPKLEYEVNFLFVQGKLNLLNLHNLKKENNLIFRPEIGITIFGIYAISYGRNVVLHKNEIELIGKNQVSFTANFNFL